ARAADRREAVGTMGEPCACGVRARMDGVFAIAADAQCIIVASERAAVGHTLTRHFIRAKDARGQVERIGTSLPRHGHNYKGLAEFQSGCESRSLVQAS